MRALLFDLDDTLYPRDAFVRSGFWSVADHVAARSAVPTRAAFATLCRARAHGESGHEFQALCRTHAIAIEVIPTLIDVFRRHRPAITLSNPVKTMLHRARGDGWRTGVITNGDPAVQRRKVDALGIGALVDCVVYAEEHIPGGKPHPIAFRDALQLLQTPPTAAVMAGDDPWRDTLGARRAGLRAIEVTTYRAASRGHVETTAAARPDAVASSVLQVPAIAAMLLEENPRAV